jgi:hypothetical protein
VCRLKNEAARADNLDTGGLPLHERCERLVLFRKLRIERDKAQASRPTKSLYSVRYLEFVVYVCQVEVYRPLANIKHVGDLFAGLTLYNKSQNFDLALRKLDRFFLCCSIMHSHVAHCCSFPIEGFFAIAMQPPIGTGIFSIKCF